MYFNYPYLPHGNPYFISPYQGNPYTQMPHYNYNRATPIGERQLTFRGQATWTEGGPVTKCGIPWSENEYMTVAVGDNSPYQCGQTLKIRNLSLSGSRDILVTVVDHVSGYPPTRINLQRKAFEALGANPEQGVINIAITPHPDLEQERWGKYLMEIIQTSYPKYNVTDYDFIGKTQVSSTQTKETYEFDLQSSQENIKIRGNVVYNPNTDRVISLDLAEV